MCMKDNPEETIKSFLDQFGPLDEYKLVVLNIIFEELYGKNLSISNEKRQDNNQSLDNNEGATMPSEENR